MHRPLQAVMESDWPPAPGKAAPRASRGTLSRRCPERWPRNGFIALIAFFRKRRGCVQTDQLYAG